MNSLPDYEVNVCDNIGLFLSVNCWCNLRSAMFVDHNPSAKWTRLGPKGPFVAYFWVYSLWKGTVIS